MPPGGRGTPSTIYIHDKKRVVDCLEQTLRRRGPAGDARGRRRREVRRGVPQAWPIRRRKPRFSGAGASCPASAAGRPRRGGSRSASSRSPRHSGCSGSYRVPRFALRRFEVSGNARVRTEEVLAAESAWSGRNLLALDLAPLAGRLAAHPWIERVTLSKRFPDGLSARISERRAVALYRDGEQFWWVGADGNLIAPYDPRGDRTKYVIVTGERRVLPEAVALLVGIARGAAGLRRRPLGNRLAPGRGIRYDGRDLSKAGAACFGQTRRTRFARCSRRAGSLRVAGGRRGPSISVLPIASFSSARTARGTVSKWSGCS